uniref:THD domain-containing protein n=1 Tax=Magallana gigas TaxID=29159 RepID=K1RKV7_MAGGI
MCCLEDGSLASLARKVLKIGDSEKPIDKDSFSWWRERPNSAHLYLKDWYRTQLHWTASEETGSAFSKLSIVDQNKLVIKKTANYFVYAAVVFDFRTVTKVPQVYYNITSFLPVLPHLQPFVLMDTFSWWRERPNSAHLYLKDLYRTQLHWTATEETGSAFSKLSIVDQNKLVIKKTANYFVYAAVVFDFRTVTKVPQVYYNITSFLPVLPHLQPFVLMGKNGGSPFSEKRHTGYLCGISKFYKGHQISVSVNDHSFIDNTPYANFFGIFRL